MTPAKLETLDQIGLRHGTDKASDRNDYLAFYARFLDELRDRPVRVLELGVLQGASLRMWRDYFPLGQIIGVDIDPLAREHRDDRIAIEIGDQSDTQVLDRLAALGPFDLVVDDASHIWAHQIAAFQRLAPALNPGGIYVIEDLDTSYGYFAPAYRGPGGVTTATYLHELSDWVMGHRVMDPETQTGRHLRDLWPIIDFVAFSRGTALIRRHTVARAPTIHFQASPEPKWWQRVIARLVT
jgi:predicted O-methyltransferase YrrM